MAKYVALVRKDPTSDFSIDFPDFPGCITVGSTLDEARDMAEEALDFHIDGMLEDGDPIPEPSSIDAILEDPENRDVATVFLVEAKSAVLKTA